MALDAAAVPSPAAAAAADDDGIWSDVSTQSSLSGFVYHSGIYSCIGIVILTITLPIDSVVFGTPRLRRR